MRNLLAAALVTSTLACQPPAATDKPTDKPAEKPTEGAQGSANPAERGAPKPADLAAPPDVAAAPADATKTPSGLAYKVQKPGTGTEKPTADDTVEVHYSGWTTDGRMFDSSVKRGKPAKFPLKGVIKGWTEGVQLMTVGEKTRFWIPADLAYGETPMRPGAPSGMLVFDIELISIKKALPMPEAPADVAAAPKDAKKTASGLAYKSLKAGDGKTHPKETDTVEVHYAGWTKDGKMFDASYKRGDTATFPLNRVIPGWTEGVQLMTVGEKMRFWIPADLAYGDTPRAPGAPSGMLVFDIDLVSIKQ
jgi:FKBP-type peptidyl-prolyl cis-trans isomerase